MARMPDGTEEPYWNTFYQQVDYLRPTVQQLMQISGLQYSAAVRLHSMLAAALNAGQSRMKSTLVNMQPANLL